MFDRVEIVSRGGTGGSGAVSFRREKYIPFGGPDGGDGGNGGSVILRADSSVTHLGMFRNKGVYKAAAGDSGRGQGKHGKKGGDLVLAVPVGTVVWQDASADERVFIADLSRSGQEIAIARGGKGGWGNTRFVTSTNQAPRLAQKGELGEEVAVYLEMRLIADVGIVGYPNVGKSTLLAAVSQARPKIASYPFTTLEPALGVVESETAAFIIAEIPGLVEEAHLGRGLGHEFLRHVARTRVLIHVLDGTSASLTEDMKQVNKELSLYDPALSGKPQLVAVNKIDLPGVRPSIGEMKDALAAAGVRPVFISAVTGEGVAGLIDEVWHMLQAEKDAEKTGDEAPLRVFRPQPRVGKARVYREGDAFVIAAPELERIMAGTNVSQNEILGYLKKQFPRFGIDKALHRAGIKPGDRVRLGDFEWEWQ